MEQFIAALWLSIKKLVMWPYVTMLERENELLRQENGQMALRTIELEGVVTAGETECRQLQGHTGRLVDTIQRLTAMVGVDPLTKLLNRQGAAVVFERSMSLLLHSKKHVPVVAAFIDLDGFKEVNDMFGHTRGDAALKIISELLHTAFRHTDIIMRNGGDEFVVLLLDSDIQVGKERVATLIEAIRRDLRLVIGGTRITASLGLAADIIDAPGDIELVYARLIEMADAAMYQAKRGGKNQYVVVDDRRMIH